MFYALNINTPRQDVMHVVISDLGYYYYYYLSDLSKRLGGTKRHSLYEGASHVQAMPAVVI